jgi:transglutaminase-like putative cysteine protease
VTGSRRPASLLPASAARLLAFALLGSVAALQWARMIDGASQARALTWVATAIAAAILVLVARRRRGRAAAAALAAAVLAGLLAALALSGLDLVYLKPARWDELLTGLGRGAEALTSVRLPYIGRDPWVGATVEVSGALALALAAVLVTLPGARDGHRFAALSLLLVLAASPVVSLGVQRPVALGLVLAALTACFLWLEHVPGRPGLGLAILGAVALAVSVPLGAAADREEAWFDYKSFAEGLGPGRPVRFDWNHGYGPIRWPRDGVELFRVHKLDEDGDTTGSGGPLYWKAEVLNDFDGRAWTTASRTDPGGDEPEDDLPSDWRDRPAWNTRFEVSLRRLRTANVVGAGTVLDVTGASRPVEPAAIPGMWIAEGARDLARGDSYTVRAHVPRPTPVQLAAATAGQNPSSAGATPDARRAGALTLPISIREDALEPGPRTPPTVAAPQGRPIEHATIEFPPFQFSRAPTAHYVIVDRYGSGNRALERSEYDRTWALAKSLRRRATSPYDYVLRVNAYLRGPRFSYTEVPPVSADEAPLEFFLFDSRQGYCQQFSGAMALLLRMGGIPARVASGFSPGGYRRSSNEWVVRDTDAHSWVEAWFDGIGWVTFDPTPPATPARSQVAAIAPSAAETAAATPTATPTPEGATARRPEGLSPERTPAPTATPGDAGGAVPGWALPAGAGALLALGAAALVVRRRRHGPGTDDPAERALAELERALRRSGRSMPPGTTLIGLERRLGSSGSGAAYLRSLRAARYGGAGVLPGRKERAAFREELAAGLGWQGRLRALWALPPRLGR